MAFTLGAPCTYQEEIRKSRFLAQAAPVSSATDDQLRAMARTAHPKICVKNWWAVLAQRACSPRMHPRRWAAWA